MAVAVAAVGAVVLVGALGLLAALRTSSDGAGASPAGLGAGSRDITVAAEDYRTLLAVGDLSTLEASTVLTVEARSGGATVGGLLQREVGCLDWAEAELIDITTPVTPTNGVATYSDGDRTVARPLGLADEQFETVAPDAWYVVLDDPPCDEVVGGAG